MIGEQLIQMIGAEVSLDPTHEITLETDLLLTGLVDSLGVVRIVGWIEDELGIEVDPLDVVLDNFQSVGQMVAYIERRQAAST